MGEVVVVEVVVVVVEVLVVCCLSHFVFVVCGLWFVVLWVNCVLFVFVYCGIDVLLLLCCSVCGRVACGVWVCGVWCVGVWCVTCVRACVLVCSCVMLDVGQSETANPPMWNVGF